MSTDVSPAASGIAGRLSRRLPFFYGWVVVYIGFLGVFLSGTTSFWGLPVFVGPMHDDTGWSHAGIFGAFAVRSITGAFCGLALGRLADHLRGPSLMLLFGVLIDAGALLSIRWVESSTQFLILYGLVGGAGSSGTRLLQSTLIPKWFVSKRGTAIGFASLGGGASALLMVPVIAVLVSQLGWRDAWTCLGAMMLVLMLPCVPLAVRAPEDIGLLPDNGEMPPAGTNRASSATERSFTFREATHTWTMWVLLIAVVFGSYSLNTNSIVMVPYFEEKGFSSGVAASALSVYGLASVVTRLGWGYIADRFTVRPALVAQASLTGLGALLLLQVESRESLYAVATLEGVLMSGFPTLSSLLWPTFFGRRHLGSIVGLTQMFTTISSAAGPLIAGLIHDRTGTYTSALWMLFATWLTCAAVTLAVRPRRLTDSVSDSNTAMA